MKHRNSCSNQFASKIVGEFVLPCPAPTMSVCQYTIDDTNLINKIYVSGSDGHIYSYNVNTNSFLQESPVLTGFNTICYHPDNALYGFYGTAIKRLNIITGSSNPLTALVPTNCAGACFDGDKNMFMYNFPSATLYKVSGIDVLNDTLPVTINNFGGTIAGSGMTGGGDVTFFQGELYLVGVGPGGIKLVQVNFSSPARTALDVTPFNVLGIITYNGSPITGIIGMTVLNGVLYLCNSTDIFSLNVNTLVATHVATAVGFTMLDAACILESTNS